MFLSLFDNQVKALSGNVHKGTQQFVGNYREIPGALKYNYRPPTHSTQVRDSTMGSKYEITQALRSLWWYFQRQVAYNFMEMKQV